MAMSRRAATLILATIAVLVAGTAAAVTPEWLAQNWRDLGPRERYDAWQNYQRHERLPQDRQRDIEKRYEQWQGMSPEEQNRVRQNYQRYQQLPPDERER